MSAKKWIGIATIAIIVFRLWDIPLDSVAQPAAPDEHPVWMQVLAWSIIHVIVRGVKAFRRWTEATTNRSRSEQQIRRSRRAIWHTRNS
jgi:hypothetical protein